jgi:hypothetical protein
MQRSQPKHSAVAKAESRWKLLAATELDFDGSGRLAVRRIFKFLEAVTEGLRLAKFAAKKSVEFVL